MTKQAFLITDREAEKAYVLRLPVNENGEPTTRGIAEARKVMNFTVVYNLEKIVTGNDGMKDLKNIIKDAETQ